MPENLFSEKHGYKWREGEHLLALLKHSPFLEDEQNGIIPVSFVS